MLSRARLPCESLSHALGLHALLPSKPLPPCAALLRLHPRRMDTLSPRSLSDRDRLDLVHLVGVLAVLTRTRTRNSVWRTSSLLARQAPVCAVCGVHLVPCGSGHTQPPNAAAVDLLIPEAHGGIRRANNLLLTCDACRRARQGRDLLLWEPAQHHPHLLTLRAAALEHCPQHPSRHPWKSADPVLRELRERWRNPRCELFCAQRDAWDTGEAVVAATPFPGWVIWRVGAEPTALARYLLHRSGWQPLPASTAPGWVLGVVPGMRWRETAWALVGAHTWLRRLDLPTLPRGIPEPKPPAPLPDRGAVVHAGGGVWVPGLDGQLGRLEIWTPAVRAMERAWEAMTADYATAVAAYETALAAWRAWPPPGSRSADDDWWRAFSSLGEVVRRRPCQSPTGRYRARPPWCAVRAPRRRR